MLSGEFQRKLKQLNRALHIYCSDDDARPAGVVVNDGLHEPETICGVSKNWVPEFSTFLPNGAIKTGGWRRVVDILIARGLTSRKRVEQVFGFHYDSRNKPPKQQVELEPWYKQWLEAKEAGKKESIRKTGKLDEHYMRWQDIVDIHRMKKKGEK